VRSIANHLRGKISRALIISSASALMLGVGLPVAAQAAPSTSAAPAALSRSSHDHDCYRYDFDHDGYHYYRYCYDYSYRDSSDERHDKRWYESYELYYWYFRDGHKHFGSCSFDHDFGYHHPDRPWKSHCPSH
jgi:hypothetical protein